jgi:DNA-3-methyladenine glycosylase
MEKHETPKKSNISIDKLLNLKRRVNNDSDDVKMQKKIKLDSKNNFEEVENEEEEVRTSVSVSKKTNSPESIQINLLTSTKMLLKNNNLSPIKSEMKKLERDFFMIGCVDLAKKLLGKIIVRKVNNEFVHTRIVETEAYAGPEDKACHCYNGKKTERTKFFWQKGGHLYVYVIYGTNNCMNIIAGEADKPEGVLIRAVEPIKGLDVIKKIRGGDKPYKTVPQLAELTNGPGKVGAALQLDRSHNALDLCSSEDMYLIEDPTNLKFVIERSVRINIDYAEEYRFKPWRFFIKNNSYVSKVKPKHNYKDD